LTHRLAFFIVSFFVLRSSFFVLCSSLILNVFFAPQPLMLYKADIREYASRRMLRYFIPITIIFTPLGQITGDRVSTDIVEAVGGVLVTLVAVFEIYQKRNFFASLLCRYFNKHVEKNPDAQMIKETDESEHGSEGDHGKKNPDTQMIMEADESENSEGGDSVCLDELAALFNLDTTISENAEVVVEASESEVSINIDDFSSHFDLDAEVSENLF
jgi:hypothetical protein